VKLNLFHFLLVISLIIFTITGYFVWQRYTPIPPPKLTSQPQIASASATLRIAIPSLNLDIPVYEAKIQGTHWEYSTIGISHLSGTPWAGQSGNAVYYGHNWPNLLGNLHQIKIGDKLVITPSVGPNMTLTVTAKEIVSPDQISVIAPTIDSRLTLFTCIGFLDRQRLVVIAQ
jgi:LPXTG-site transpeptidase (sortase) family protein